MTFSSVVKNKCVQAFTLIGAIAAVVTGFYSVDDRYAKAAQVAQVEQQVELLGYEVKYQKLIMRRNAVQQRIWDLERHYGGRGLPSAPAPVKHEYNYLISELEDINRQLKGK
jgi:hypothetical protein